MSIFYRNLVLSRPELVALLSQVESQDKETFNSIINFLDSVSCSKAETKNFSLSLCSLVVLFLQIEIDNLIGFSSKETLVYFEECLKNSDPEAVKHYKEIYLDVIEAKDWLQKENYFLLCATIKLATEYTLFYLKGENLEE